MILKEYIHNVLFEYSNYSNFFLNKQIKIQKLTNRLNEILFETQNQRTHNTQTQSIKRMR